MAQSEMQTDLPEYSDWKKPEIDDRRLTPRERERYYEPGGIAALTDREYWERVYPGHHIPADIYHGLNVRPYRRR